VKDSSIARKAACAVNNALRKGTIAKGPCETCGKEPAHGHHDDYLKPLEVRWLCRSCHTLWHKKNGHGANGDHKTVTTEQRSAAYGLAGECGCAPRTATAWLLGDKVAPMAAYALERAADDLGIAQPGHSEAD